MRACLTGDVLRKSAREPASYRAMRMRGSCRSPTGFYRSSHRGSGCRTRTRRGIRSRRSLPRLFEDLTLRRRVLALPLLSGRASDLTVRRSLLRAATILGVLAHAYFCVATFLPAELPSFTSCAPGPRSENHLASRRRSLPTFTNIIYNSRLCDPLRPDPMRFGNLRLLVPTVDTTEERIFF